MAPKTENRNSVLKSINPATLEVNAEIPVTPMEDIAGVIEKARCAQKDWARIGINGRLKYIKKVKSYISDNLDDICAVITMDNGKTLTESVSAEVMPVFDMVNFCVKDAPGILRKEPVNSTMLKLGRIRSYNVFEPLGVIAIIAPWNFPFAIPVTQMLMALTAGNTVVLKPAALTAYVGQTIGQIFSRCGFPEGVVNVIQGSGSVVGNALFAAGVDKVAFTGSVPVGKHLMQKAGQTLTPITLELGGKDPFIVLEDADIERASSGAVWGSFINAGQVCASVERVYVHKKVAKQFIGLVETKTKKLRIGNGLDFETDMGPLIDEGQLESVEAHVEDAVKKGARVLAGGHRADSLPGYFFLPTVLVDVDHNMDCMMEETFGPTMPIMVVSDEDEAVELANDSRFALTASVWSRDVSRAEALCRRIVTGTATVNDCEFTYGFAQCPWGGPKESGIGRTHSAHGLLEFTSMKNVAVTSPLMQENLWWYPYSENKYTGLKAFMRAAYLGGITAKCNGIKDTLKAIRT